MRLSIRDPPAIKPLEMTPLAGRSDHTKADRPEEPVEEDDGGVHDAEDRPFDPLVQAPSCKVDTATHNDDCKPQSRIVVMDIGYTTHSNEREVMQHPPDDGVEAGVVELIDFRLLQVVVAALPAHGVEEHEQYVDSKAGGADPVDERVAEKEVFYDWILLEHIQPSQGEGLTVVVPATHAETNIKDRPLPERRGKVVLLVRVGNKCVVGSHHGNVQVDEVLEEGGLVVTWVTGRKTLVNMALDVPVSVHIARVVGLDASSLNLLEAPLRQIDIAGAEVAIEVHMFQADRSGEGPELRAVV
jgi:hypothetical protein